ncbi:MAG: hypothetical protein BM562_08890 [Alphaproteobacteria bacterium MedPE-SWcel]|nr:MAG: hypothetical protein BM562_08890 [Alphaproteobacteria bacterium MedPE-SWcel]
MPKAFGCAVQVFCDAAPPESRVIFRMFAPEKRSEMMHDDAMRNLRVLHDPRNDLTWDRRFAVVRPSPKCAEKCARKCTREFARKLASAKPLANVHGDVFCRGFIWATNASEIRSRMCFRMYPRMFCGMGL